MMVHSQCYQVGLLVRSNNAISVRSKYVLVLDGNSDKGAHVWSEIFNLTCLRHFFRSRHLHI